MLLYLCSMWQRYAIGLSMLFIYLMTTFRFLAPVIHYQLDYTYISEVLCINRDKPQLQCHGKCHLQKQIRKINSSEKEKEALQHLVNAYHAVEGLPQATYVLPALLAAGTPSPPDFYSFACCHSMTEALFHPPQV